MPCKSQLHTVMTGLVPVIHVDVSRRGSGLDCYGTAWMAGTDPRIESGDSHDGNDLKINGQSDCFSLVPTLEDRETVHNACFERDFPRL